MSVTHLRLVEHPAASRHRLRQRLSGLIDRLICALDDLDGDPDLEDGADDEPSLSASIPLAHWSGSQDLWLQGAADDREDACEDEGGEHDGREPGLVGVEHFTSFYEHEEANGPEAYDAAQDRGEIRTRADNQLVPGENKLSAEDLGLSRKDNHEARQ